MSAILIKIKNTLFSTYSEMWCLMRSKKVTSDDSTLQNAWKESEIREKNDKIAAQQVEIARLKNLISDLVERESERRKTHDRKVAKLEEKIANLKQGGREMCSACEVYENQLQDIVQKLEESLTCPIMYDVMENPVILPTTKTLVDARAVMGSIIDGVKTHAKCPFTRKVFRVDEVKESHAVKEIITHLRHLQLILIKAEARNIEARLTNVLMSAACLHDR
jgi:U-box domain